eukprot:TRINITY_DN15584_c0_g1_i1.p1 TRINITY_DN15584_c0_g1~~TRINITY_DN15584_c0_g1_i1.p1  ORF type:complete len:212 (+),score=39.29 TRINITY_DN15584_c0_g1_i1:40-675(+)
MADSNGSAKEKQDERNPSFTTTDDSPSHVSRRKIVSENSEMSETARARCDLLKQNSLELKTVTLEDDSPRNNKGLKVSEKQQRLFMVKQLSSLHIMGRGSQRTNMLSANLDSSSVSKTPSPTEDSPISAGDPEFESNFYGDIISSPQEGSDFTPSTTPQLSKTKVIEEAHKVIESLVQLQETRSELLETKNLFQPVNFVIYRIIFSFTDVT